MFVFLIQVGKPPPTPDYDEIAAVLRQEGHNICVATPNEFGDLIFNDGNKNIATIKMPGSIERSRYPLAVKRWIHEWWENWKFITHLRKLIVKMQPDIVQVNEARLPFIWFFPLGLGWRTKFVLDWRQIAERSFSGRFAGLRRRLHLVKRRFPSRYIYSRACFLDSAGAERILGRRWQKWGTVVPLAVSPDFLKADIPNRSYDQDTRVPIRFIYIGSLSRVRRLERIIEAAKVIQETEKSSNQFLITFIGPDKSRGNYAGMAKELGLNGIIQFVPPVPYDEVPMVLAKSDVALAYIPEVPADWRYHPTLKIMEYRAIGIPIIATDFRPNRAIVENGRNGLLVENSVESLAQAMRRFINDRHFLQECRRNAQAMRQGKIWKDVSLMYERLYLNLMAG